MPETMSVMPIFCLNVYQNAKENLSLGFWVTKIKTDTAEARYPNSWCNQPPPHSLIGLSVLESVCVDGLNWSTLLFRSGHYTYQTIWKGNNYQDLLLGKFCTMNNITTGYKNFASYTLVPKIASVISFLIYSSALIYFFFGSLHSK